MNSTATIVPCIEINGRKYAPNGRMVDTLFHPPGVRSADGEYQARIERGRRYWVLKNQQGEPFAAVCLASDTGTPIVVDCSRQPCGKLRFMFATSLTTDRILGIGNTAGPSRVADYLWRLLEGTLDPAPGSPLDIALDRAIDDARSMPSPILTYAQWRDREIGEQIAEYPEVPPAEIRSAFGDRSHQYLYEYIPSTTGDIDTRAALSILALVRTRAEFYRYLRHIDRQPTPRAAESVRRRTL